MNSRQTRGFCLSFFLYFCCLTSVHAQVRDQAQPAAPPPNFSELIRLVILESAKEPYVNEKYWNKTSTRFDGLRIRGLRISKRKRKVRHGFCRKYSAELVNPDKNFKFEIREKTDSNYAGQTYLIESRMRARCEGTFAHYVYGVKGVNGSTVADADLQIQILLSVNPETQFSLTAPIPKFSLGAKVRDVDFKLKDIDVRKVGVLQGKFVEIMGDGFQEAIEQLVQQQEGRIKKKLQKELDEL